MQHWYQISLFRAEQAQKLRNVRVHSPCLIQLISGSKRLFWKGASEDLNRTQFLLCEPSMCLNFENLPEKGRFLSRVYSFYLPPKPAMLQLSQRHGHSAHSPAIPASKALEQTLNALFTFQRDLISRETQAFWLMGLYQQLAEMGVLHLMFPDTESSFSQSISRYLSASPAQEHPLTLVAEKFAMSRATFIRKLKQEGTQYREVLAEVRLNHALALMQNGQSNIAILAQECGYRSENRFSQRFKQKFGLTPGQYFKTIG